MSEYERLINDFKDLYKLYNNLYFQFSRLPNQTQGINPLFKPVQTNLSKQANISNLSGKIKNFLFKEI